MSKAQLAAKIAALQAQLEDRDDGVYEDPSTGRWFIVMRPPGAAKTTTRRRAPDGNRLTTRDQTLVAKRQWEARMASGAVVVGRECFEDFWPRYLRHAKAEMAEGSWEDVRAHGTKRLLPFFGGMQMSQIVVDTVRGWRAVMHEAVEAGEYAPKTINNAGTVKIHTQRTRGDSLATRPQKGRNFRTVAIGPGWSFLGDMLAVRAEHSIDDGGWLFLVPPSARGRHAERAAPPPPIAKQSTTGTSKRSRTPASRTSRCTRFATPGSRLAGHRALTRIRARAARAQLGEGHQRLLRAS